MEQKKPRDPRNPECPVCGRYLFRHFEAEGRVKLSIKCDCGTIVTLDMPAKALQRRREAPIV